MPRSTTELVFVADTDDTPENRAVVELAEERAAAPRSQDRDLDELLEAFGYHADNT